MNHVQVNERSKLLIGLIIISSLGFLIGVFFSDVLTSYAFKASFLLLVFFLYLLNIKKGYLFFGIFLLCLAVKEILLCFGYFFNSDTINLVSDGFYVVSYASLFNHMLLNMKLSVLIKKHFIYLIVSLLIGFFGFLKLNETLNYHDDMFKDPWFVLTLAYNLFIILALVFSFLNYIYKKSKEALVLFASTFCIIFSEFIEIASYYPNSLELLPVLYSLLFLIGFYFVYKYITKNFYKTLV